MGIDELVECLVVDSHDKNDGKVNVRQIGLNGRLEGNEFTVHTNGWNVREGHPLQVRRYQYLRRSAVEGLIASVNQHRLPNTNLEGRIVHSDPENKWGLIDSGNIYGHEESPNFKIYFFMNERNVLDQNLLKDSLNGNIIGKDVRYRVHRGPKGFVATEIEELVGQEPESKLVLGYIYRFNSKKNTGYATAVLSHNGKYSNENISLNVKELDGISKPDVYVGRPALMKVVDSDDGPKVKEMTLLEDDTFGKEEGIVRRLKGQVQWISLSKGGFRHGRIKHISSGEEKYSLAFFHITDYNETIDSGSKKVPLKEHLMVSYDLMHTPNGLRAYNIRPYH